MDRIYRMITMVCRGRNKPLPTEHAEDAQRVRSVAQLFAIFAIFRGYKSGGAGTLTRHSHRAII